MEVLFKFEIGDIHITKKKEMQSHVNESDIIAMYETTMHLYYNKLYSSYEILSGGD